MSLAPVPRSGAEVVALLENAFAAHHQVVMARGFDPFYGRRVAGELRARGLAEVGAEGRLFCWEGGRRARRPGDLRSSSCERSSC